MLSFYVFDHGIKEGSTAEPPMNEEKAVHRIIESWEESSVNWGTQPAYSNIILDNNSNTEIKVWEDYSVTSAVFEMVKDAGSNYGFILKFPYEDDYTGARIRSSEAAEQSERPKLTVTYSLDTEISGSVPLKNNRFRITQTLESYVISGPFSGQHTVLVSDLRGRVLTALTAVGSSTRLQVPVSLSTGIYFITVSTPANSYTEKFSLIQ